MEDAAKFCVSQSTVGFISFAPFKGTLVIEY